MSNIKELIRKEVERLIKENDNIRCDSNKAYCQGYGDAFVDLLSSLDTLPDESEEKTSYDTQKYAPSSSVSIEDVARVQFASHAKVFDKKRKAVFDWEQFKEVASIFYGFGKKDSQEIKEKEQPTMGYDEAYLNEKIAKASKSWEGVDVDKFMDEVRGREPVTECHDLTEAAENSWAVYEYREDPRGLYSSCYIDGFKEGAEWRKRKMMERAVEEEVQEVYRDDDGIHCCVSVGTDYKPGTIVYVITIPKEDAE